MAVPTSNPTDQPPPNSTSNSARVIPGLTNPSQPPTSSSSAKRSRKKKAAAKVEEVPKPIPELEDVPEPVIEQPVVAAPTTSVHEKPNGLPGLLPGSTPVVVPASATISPVQQVQKRIRAATKKIQRIGGYESSSTPLNEDQKRAIASKPALEATVKELQDLLKILEEDEKLDELRIQAVREEEERKVQGRVDRVVALEQKKATEKLSFLLQFLHLYSLFTSASQPTGSFAPISVPPVVQNATSQEFAAVSTLFQQLANGPIAGGDGDAFESIDNFSKGSNADIIEGVTFARIKEMILQLTAPPAELPFDSRAMSASPSTTPSVNKTEEQPLTLPPVSVPTDLPSSSANLMFLQQSEVLPEPMPSLTTSETVAPPPGPAETTSPSPLPVEREPPIDHVMRNRQLLETAEILPADVPAPNPSDWTNYNQHPVNTNPSQNGGNAEWEAPTEHLSASQAEVVARTIDWAEDVQDVERGTNTSGSNFTPLPPPPSGEPYGGQAPPSLHSHHFNNSGRGNYRGRGGGAGGYRGGPGGGRGVGNPEGYRGGRGWHRGVSAGGFRGGRGGPPMDMTGAGGWRPGPGATQDGSGGYRPRADYAGGRYGEWEGGHRGVPRGGGAGAGAMGGRPGPGYHHSIPPPPGPPPPVPHGYHHQEPVAGNWT